MKKYWINQGEFYNQYELYYTENQDQEQQLNAICPDVEQITRKKAIHKCVEEKIRTKFDRAFSGYATDMVYPVITKHDAVNGGHRLLTSDEIADMINSGKAVSRNTYFFEVIKK